MASTYSDLKIELIGTGEQAGAWGNTTNINLGTALEEAIVGRATANFTADSDLTLVLSNVNTTQIARHYVLNVTSGVTLTATRNLIVPSIDKPYIIANATTGSQSIIVKTSAGVGVTVPNGKTVMVYVNSVNVVQSFNHVPTLSLTTDLALLDGGTGASDAAGARTNLGVTATGADTTYAYRANNLSDLANITTARTNILPTQTGNAGKALVTNGTDAAWQLVGLADGDKGDITVSSAGTVWTIDTDAITTAKILNDAVTADKIATGAVGSSELASTAVTPGTYGSSSSIPQFTVDSDGRLTAASQNAIASTGGLIGYQIFTATGSYTKATNNPTFVIVEVVGGGGAGGGGTANATTGGAGAGGSAGGYAMEKILASALASSETVTIGAGGTGVSGGTGNTGGTTSFGAFCSATGGAGGGAGAGTTNGQSNDSGVGSGGNINYSGSVGAPGMSSTGSPRSGFGGNSKLSGGAKGVAGTLAGIAALANSGTGGSGGVGDTVTSRAGGAGGSGLVIVWEYT